MRHFYSIALGLSFTVGALWLRFSRPQDHSPLLNQLVDTEPVHWVAHSLLYGGLTWLVRPHVRTISVLPIVLGTGLVQEFAQVLGVRPFGGPEIFDLGVDGLAAVTVLCVLRWTAPSAGSKPGENVVGCPNG